MTYNRSGISMPPVRICGIPERRHGKGMNHARKRIGRGRHLELIKAFREIHRVLKPGGIFWHNDMLRPASRIIELPYLIYVRHSVWLTARLCGSSAACLRCVDYFADAIRQFYRPGELAALLEGVGFHNVENRNFLTGVMSYHIARKPPL